MADDAPARSRGGFAQVSGSWTVQPVHSAIDASVFGMTV
jgi:hypothetical protein